MSIEVGSLVTYNFLWEDEYISGLREGTKPDRPCMVMAEDGERFHILPITSKPVPNLWYPQPINDKLAQKMGLNEGGRLATHVVNIVRKDAGLVKYRGPEFPSKFTGIAIDRWIQHQASYHAVVIVFEDQWATLMMPPKIPTRKVGRL